MNLLKDNLHISKPPQSINQKYKKQKPLFLVYIEFNTKSDFLFC